MCPIMEQQQQITRIYTQAIPFVSHFGLLRATESEARCKFS